MRLRAAGANGERGALIEAREIEVARFGVVLRMSEVGLLAGVEQEQFNAAIALASKIVDAQLFDGEVLPESKASVRGGVSEAIEPGAPSDSHVMWVPSA